MSLANQFSHLSTIIFFIVVPFISGYILNTCRQMIFIINNFNKPERNNIPRNPVINRKILFFIIATETSIFLLFAIFIGIKDLAALPWLLPYAIFLALVIIATVFVFLGDRASYFTIKVYKHFKNKTG